jgi:hypothetical protein
MEAILLGDIHNGIAGSIPDLGVYVYTRSVVSSHDRVTPYSNQHLY